MKELWDDLYRQNYKMDADSWTVLHPQQELPVGDHDWQQILGQGLSPGKHVVKSVATIFS